MAFMANHPFQERELNARDEDGNTGCAACGRPPDVHPREVRFVSDDPWPYSAPAPSTRVESAPREPHVVRPFPVSSYKILDSNGMVTEVICGANEGRGLLCNYPPHPGDGHSWSAIDLMAQQERHPAPHQEQPLPVPNDGESMHDLVIRDILSRPVSWDLSYGRAARLRDQVAEDLLARKELGLARYGSLLQANNGRDALRDLYEELQDGAVYARQRLLETPEDGLGWHILADVYDDIVTGLVRVRRLRNAATE